MNTAQHYVSKKICLVNKNHNHLCNQTSKLQTHQEKMCTDQNHGEIFKVISKLETYFKY